MRKFLTIFIFTILAAVGIFVYWRYFYVFGDGVKNRIPQLHCAKG
jgi:hypothetical protein